MIKVSKGNLTETISHIKKTWEKFDDLISFNYHFLDESLNNQYEKDDRIAYFIELTALWCILLSLTGLLGLALFLARQRTKEIGIRKINGASIKQILIMINKDFIKWILISFVIAIPIGYYAVSLWQEDFAYKTTISWWIFALAGLLTILVSVIAVSLQALKIARKNPVEALRYE